MPLLNKKFFKNWSRANLQLCAYSMPANNITREGDFVDYFFIHPNYFYFAIGDVCGHGTRAATFKGIIKKMLRLIMLTEPVPPRPSLIAQGIIEINRVLLAEKNLHLFCSLFVGILNLKTGQLFFINAGHPTPLLLAPGKSPKLLPIKVQAVISSMQDICYRVQKLTLHPNDKLLFYTDGVTEAQDAHGKFLTEAGLIHLVKKAPNLTVDKLIKHLVKQLRKITGTQTDDDMTMLGIAYKP